MKIPIKGRRSYHYAANEIYDIILDLPAIAREYDFIEKIEETGVDRFIFTFHVNFQVYSGRYTANVSIMDKVPDAYLKLRGTHKSRVGSIAIEIEAVIKPLGDLVNELVISGHFEVGGMMRFAGKRLLSTGVSNGSALMFDLLEKKLEKKKDAKDPT